MANEYGIERKLKPRSGRGTFNAPIAKRKWSIRSPPPTGPSGRQFEHLNHLPTSQFQYPKTADYFVMACQPCNSSRRDKPLAAWVAEKRIADIVAPVVKAYLTRPEASIPIDAALAAIDALAAHQRRLSRQRRRPEAALAIAA